MGFFLRESRISLIVSFSFLVFKFSFSFCSVTSLLCWSTRLLTIFTNCITNSMSSWSFFELVIIEIVSPCKLFG